MWAKIFLLFFVFSFLFRSDHSFDQDLGRHIKLGEMIVQSHQVPVTNLFSYTNPNFPFINTHWLFEVFVYFWSITLGLQSLLILKVIIFLFSVWLIFKIIPKGNEQVPSSGSRVLLLPIGFIFLHVLRERLELRPEIFSFLFTASTYYILEKYLKKATRLIYLLPLIQLLWINTHIYFFVGLILQAIFFLHIGYQHIRLHLEGGKLKILAIIFILSVLISLINPNGLAGLLYPLNVTTNYGYTIVENQTMFLLENIGFRDPNFLFVKLSIGIIALSLLTLAIKRKFELKNILLSLSSLGLALLNVRSFPYLVFLSLPAVLQNFGLAKRNFVTVFLFLVFSFMLLLESYFYLNGDYYKYNESINQVGLRLAESGSGAMNFVLANNLPNPVFNNFDIGSYIIYRGYPKYPVFVDGRPEAYPKEFFINTYIPAQYDYNKFKELDKLMSFRTIIFSHTDQTPWAKAFLQNVVKDEIWKLVYIDDFMIVLVKDAQGLPVIDLAKLSPDSYQFNNHVSFLRLGLFLLNNKYIESGRQFIAKTLQLFPDDPIANSLIGQPSKNIFFW